MADRGSPRRDGSFESTRVASIPVAELLAAHKRIRRMEPDPEPQVVDALVQPEPQPTPVHTPLRRTSLRRTSLGRPRSPSRERHAPLLLGFAAAAAVLAGTLVATHVVTKAGETHAAPESITGGNVFRPDVIRASLGDKGGTPGSGNRAADGEDKPQSGPAANGAAPGETAASKPHGPQSPGAPATMTSDAGLPGQPQPLNPPLAPMGTAPADGEPATATQSPSPTVQPIMDTIIQFYSAAPSRPTMAYELLDPAVRNGTVEEFARSWAGVTEAEVVDAVPAGPSTMVVSVVLQRTDGTRLLTRQRIVIGGGPSPKIVAAQLLSVQLL